MAKLFGIHPIDLAPGVNAEDFERFIVEEVLTRELLPGSSSTFSRGAEEIGMASMRCCSSSTPLSCAIDYSLVRTGIG